MKIFFVIPLVFLTAFAMSQTKQKKFLALGDSYTIGESVAENDRWPVLLCKALNAKGLNFEEPKIIATTGWRTDDLKRAIDAEKLSNDYDLVSLLIGVNNQYQGRSSSAYAPEFEELLKMAIEFAGGDESKVIVISIPDYGFTPYGKDKQEKISVELDEFNAVNRRISKKYRVQYFNITALSRHGLEDPSLVATDGLHPSGKMYKQWVKLIMKDLKI